MRALRVAVANLAASEEPYGAVPPDAVIDWGSASVETEGKHERGNIRHIVVTKDLEDLLAEQWIDALVAVELQHPVGLEQREVGVADLFGHRRVADRYHGGSVFLGHGTRVVGRLHVEHVDLGRPGHGSQTRVEIPSFVSRDDADGDRWHLRCVGVRRCSHRFHFFRSLRARGCSIP